MKKDTSFWLSLERYFFKVIKRNPLPYTWIGVVAVGVVVVVSWLSHGQSLAGVKTQSAVIERAAQHGDYVLAQTLFEQIQDLRFKIQVEDLVYPERKVQKRISELEQALALYPENREVYLSLSELYRQLNNTDKENEYREKARVLDPNWD